MLFVFVCCYNKDMKNSDWPLVGNEQISAFLSKSISNKKIAGAYIFYGPENLGKKDAAFYFAKTLLCAGNNSPCGKCHSCKRFKAGDANLVIHSDLFFLKKREDKKNISIEQIRDFILRLGMSSFANSYKIGIIEGADFLSTEAANALLKTLEEPQKNTVIILLTANLPALPKTIVSRSQVLNFNLVKTELIHDYLAGRGITRSAAKHFAHLSAGRPVLALKFLDDKDFYNTYLERAKMFLDFFGKDINGRISILGGFLKEKESGQEAVAHISEVLKIWEGVARDLILLELGQNDLIRNDVIRKDLEKINIRNKIGNLLKISSNIKQAENYLQANVNPRLVLEQVAINI